MRWSRFFFLSLPLDGTTVEAQIRTLLKWRRRYSVKKGVPYCTWFRYNEASSSMSKLLHREHATHIEEHRQLVRARFRFELPVNDPTLSWSAWKKKNISSSAQNYPKQVKRRRHFFEWSLREHLRRKFRDAQRIILHTGLGWNKLIQFRGKRRKRKFYLSTDRVCGFYVLFREDLLWVLWPEIDLWGSRSVLATLISVCLSWTSFPSISFLESPSLGNWPPCFLARAKTKEGIRSSCELGREKKVDDLAINSYKQKWQWQWIMMMFLIS